MKGDYKIMEDLKERYEKIKLTMNETVNKINALLDDEKVKEYLELRRQLESLSEQQKEFYRLIRIKEYSSCKHIWVSTLHDYDPIEGRATDYCGCMKCGLDQRVFYIAGPLRNKNILTFDQSVMYDFMKDNRYFEQGINTKVLCDLDLARAIYSKIKEAHPDIDDVTAIKYFEIALDNIRNIKVSKERKISRAKRLSLSPDFNRWKSLDVRKY